MQKVSEIDIHKNMDDLWNGMSEDSRKMFQEVLGGKSAEFYDAFHLASGYYAYAMSVAKDGPHMLQMFSEIWVALFKVSGRRPELKTLTIYRADVVSSGNDKIN